MSTMNRSHLTTQSKIIHIVIVILLFGMTASCRSQSETEEALQYANALLRAVEAFELARHDTSQQIGETTNRITGMAVNAQSEAQSTTSETESILTDQPNPSTEDQTAQTPGPVVELSGLAKAWEEEWQTVHNQFDELEAKFSDVGKRSVAYFDQLNKIKEGIADADLKLAEEQKNKELLTRWTTAFEQASADIAGIKKQILIGDDFEKVLRLAAMRGTLEEDIKQLQEISHQAQTLLIQVEQLTIAGRELTSGLVGQQS
jgi:type II secretory pathway pseudopilin PulG